MQNYKNNLLKTIISEYEDYQTLKTNEGEEAQKLRKRYSSEVAEAKIKEVREENEKVSERYNTNVRKAYEKEMNIHKDRQAKTLTGSSISDDVKLLNTPQLRLTKSEIQLLADRHRNNDLMTRIIGNYAEENKLDVNITLNNSNEEKIKVVEEVYNASLMCRDDNMRMALLTEMEFGRFDNILSSEGSSNE